jgi:hypothetical protein
VQAGDGVFRCSPEGTVKTNLAPSPRTDGKDCPRRDGGAEHLLQAKGLGTELHLIVVPATSAAALELHWKRLRAKLDEVGDPNKPKPIRTEPQAPDGAHPSLPLFVGRVSVYTAVEVRPFDGVNVVGPESFQAVQRAPPRTEQKVVQGRQRWIVVWVHDVLPLVGRISQPTRRCSVTPAGRPVLSMTMFAR